MENKYENYIEDNYDDIYDLYDFIKERQSGFLYNLDFSKLMSFIVDDNFGDYKLVKVNPYFVTEYKDEINIVYGLLSRYKVINYVNLVNFCCTLI